MTRKRRRDDADDLLPMAFGAAPFIDGLRAGRDPDDDPEDDGDGEDEEDGDDEDEDDDHRDENDDLDNDELEF
jgi:hypothetical protein